MLNYRLEYENIAGDKFRVIFGVLAISPTIVDLNGYVTLKRDSAKQVFDPIRPTVCEINVIANNEFNFQEFITAPEGSIVCSVERNDVPIFVGFINPDGIFQDFVNPEWEITINATDGLHRLKNQAFNPEFITLPALQESFILYSCLKQINAFEVNKIAYFDDQNLFNLSRNFVNLDNYKNENGTFISCEEIVKDILEKRNCCLFLDVVDNELVWVVYSNYTRANNPNLAYNVYNFIGSGWNITKQFVVPQVTVFSDVNAPNNSAPVHVNKNQVYDFLPTIQSKRAEMTWRRVLNINRALFNSTFYELVNSLASFSSGTIIVSEATWIGSDPFIPMANNITPQAVFDGTAKYKLSIPFRNRITTAPSTDVLWLNQVRIYVQIKAFVSATNQTFFLNVVDNQTVWVESAEIIQSAVFRGYYAINEQVENNFDIEIPELTGDYGLTIQILLPRRLVNTNVSFSEITFLAMVLTYASNTYGKGIYYDATRTSFQSSFVPEPLKALNGNNFPPFFTNNLLQSNGLPMEEFNRGSVFYDDILEQFVIERLSLAQRVRKRFNGSVLNYVPYLCSLSYANVQGLFAVVSWKYETDRNIIDIEAHEVTAGNVAVNYEKSFIFDEERNVKIKAV
jgi:hypothetical protein